MFLLDFWRKHMYFMSKWKKFLFIFDIFWDIIYEKDSISALSERCLDLFWEIYGWVEEVIVI